MALHILYSNDLHNHSRPLARIPQLRHQHSLLLDAGDAIAGSNTAFRWQEPILWQMRELGYEAMTMGNREFHYFRFVQRWREQERAFPLLACNLQDLRQAQWSWRPFIERTHHDVRVAIVGATPVQYPLGSNWERLTGFRFLDPEVCLPPLLETLRPRCDVVVFLSHLGLEADLKLAARGLPVDLILGGHSHDFTPEPIWRGATALLHGGANGRYLGEIFWDGPKELLWKAHPCS